MTKAICPSCRRGVCYLIDASDLTFYLNGGYDISESAVDDPVDFLCPHCMAVVARDEIEAVALLSGRMYEEVQSLALEKEGGA